VLSVVVLAACGGVDDEDPEAVARALAEANYICDEAAVERINELTLPSEREPIEPRPDNCGAGSRSPVNSGQLDEFDRETDDPPGEPPELQLASGPEQGDFVTISVADDEGESDITLVRTEDGWRWNPGGEPSL